MEARNTPPEPSLEWLDDVHLTEDMCIALRNVGVYEMYLPTPRDEMVQWVERVQRLHVELVRRAVPLSDRLDKLSAETGWRMQELLDDCLVWPKKVPRVRESDGIRRLSRCSMCQKREYPDGTQILMCDECLRSTIAALERREPLNGLIFFRTYNASRRCEHADDDTVLMTFDEYDFLENGRCQVCLLQEESRRALMPTPSD